MYITPSLHTLLTFIYFIIYFFFHIFLHLLFSVKCKEMNFIDDNYHNHEYYRLFYKRLSKSHVKMFCIKTKYTV